MDPNDKLFGAKLEETTTNKKKKNTKAWKYYSQKVQYKNLYSVMAAVYRVFVRKKMIDMCWNPYETKENYIINNINAMLAPKLTIYQVQSEKDVPDFAST